MVATSGVLRAQNAETTRLHALFDHEWDYNLSRNPTWASVLGDRRWNDQWNDLSLAGIEKHGAHQRDVLKELRVIARGKLSADDRLNFDLFEKNLENQIAELPIGLHLMPINQRGGIQTQEDLGNALRFETVKDYEDWIARLNRFPGYMDQTIALMREGLRRKMVHPKIVMQRVPAQIDKQIVEKAEDSPFWKVFAKFHSAIAEADQRRLGAEASKAIAGKVILSYRKLKLFFENEYLPACLGEVGAWQWPDGDKIYQHVARKFTTTEMTSEEIHQTGLSEVKRIRGEMEKIRKQVGFKRSLDEFFTHLRTDPKFFYRTGEELLAGYRALSKRVDPLIVKLFRTLPRMPYGVEAIPENIAPDTTTAYYRWPAPDGSRAGTYFVNLYQPGTRPKWEMMALSLHEAVPGHHLQIALAQEQKNLPRFRRHMSFTAYIEGWGLYAESLGEELGLYDDPYDKFGQLTYEMWRAVRLVVDTGIHAKKWSRDRAINFFMANAPKTRNDVVNEVDRYIAWPGQALAYKIGELKIKELRAFADQSLGDRFDLKAFHDVVLLSGAVPLDILEKRVKDWVATRPAAK